MSYKCILIFILLLPVAVIGQNIAQNDTIKDKFNKDNFNNFKFDIINIDTVLAHYVSGEYNSPKFKRIDSTKIWADLILIDPPGTIDSIYLKIKVEIFMKASNINKAFVFRDKYSSLLFGLSSYDASQLLKGRGGYLGEFNIE